MVSDWPQYSDALNFSAEEEQMNMIMDAVRAIRNRRAEMNVPHSKRAKIYISTSYVDTFRLSGEFMQKLAGASEVEVEDGIEIDGAVCIVTDAAKIYIPMATSSTSRPSAQGSTRNWPPLRSSLTASTPSSPTRTSSPSSRPGRRCSARSGEKAEREDSYAQRQPL